MLGQLARFCHGHHRRSCWKEKDGDCGIHCCGSGDREPFLLLPIHHHHGSSASSIPPNISPIWIAFRWTVTLLFRLVIIVCGCLAGFALYHRTTNMWTLKNLGDSLLVKQVGRRPIVLGAFHRPVEEQNVKGNFAVSDI